MGWVGLDGNLFAHLLYEHCSAVLIMDTFSIFSCNWDNAEMINMIFLFEDIRQKSHAINPPRTLMMELKTHMEGWNWYGAMWEGSLYIMDGFTAAPPSNMMMGGVILRIGWYFLSFHQSGWNDCHSSPFSSSSSKSFSSSSGLFMNEIISKSPCPKETRLSGWARPLCS